MTDPVKSRSARHDPSAPAPSATDDRSLLRRGLPPHGAPLSSPHRPARVRAAMGAARKSAGPYHGIAQAAPSVDFGVPRGLQAQRVLTMLFINPASLRLRCGSGLGYRTVRWITATGLARGFADPGAGQGGPCPALGTAG